MDIATLIDPTRCPDCAAVLPGSPATCPACALPLRGPLIDRLWHLSLQAADLLRERQAVLVALRAPVVAAPTPPMPGGTRCESGATDKVTVRQVQRLLLALGVVLLGVAALIFTVVAWGRMGIGGRTVILGAATAAAAVGTRIAARRELPSTAEALATLTVGLVLLDAHGIRANDLGGAGQVSAATYWAGVLVALAVLAGGAQRLVPLTALRIVAAVAAQLPVLVLADQMGAVAATAALVGQGTGVLTALRWTRPASVRLLLLAGGTLAFAGAAINATALAYGAGGSRTGVLGDTWLLVLVAAGGLALAWQHRGTVGGPESGAAVAVAALLVAAHAPMHRTWTADSATAGGVALLVGLAVLLVTGDRVPRQWTDGPLAVLAAGGGLALLDVAEPATRALTGPLHWLTAPWSGPAGSDARELLGTAWPHQGTVAVTLALLTAAAALVAVRLRAVPAGEMVAAAAGALAVITAVVLPVATRAPYLAAVLALVATGCLLLLAGARCRNASAAVGLAAAGTVATAVGLVWSLATRTATPLALLTVLLAAVAIRVVGGRDPRTLGATAVAALALIAQTGVLVRLAEHSRPAAGTAAVIAAGVLAVAAGFLARPAERRVLELSAAGGAGLAFLTVVDHALFASTALLAGGTAAALVALRRDRHRIGWAAGVLLTLSSWVRLADAGVAHPEAYTAAPALALLVVGYIARRRGAELSSWQAYGAGLCTALLPSLAVTLGEDRPARPLLLGAAALAVVLLGARFRLQAPLAVGGAVLAVDALVQLGPVAGALPRWVSIGAAGLLLLVLGMTFERRLREMRRVTARLAALG